MNNLEWNGEKIAAEMQQNIEKAVSDVAHNVEREAKRLCPTKSGALRDSIHVTTKNADGASMAMVNAASGDQYYGSFVELGTKRIAAKPFLRPALRKNKRGFNAVIKKAAKKAIT